MNKCTSKQFIINLCYVVSALLALSISCSYFHNENEMYLLVGVLTLFGINATYITILLVKKIKKGE